MSNPPHSRNSVRNASIARMKIRLSPRGIWILGIITVAAVIGPLRGPLASAPSVGVAFQYVYYWVDHFKFWGTKAPSPSLRGIEIPTINGKPLTGKPVGPHFKSSKTSFVLVASPTPIYTQPSEESRYIGSVDPGYRVRVIYQLDEKSAQNSTGRGLWVFITKEDGRTPLGWVINNTLGFQDKFVPADSWKIPALGLCIGEYCSEFSIKPTGRFIQKWDSIGRGIHLEGVNTGQIWVYQHIVWAKQDDPEDYDELLIQTPNDGLSHELKYSGEPIRISKPNGATIRLSKSKLF